MQSVVLAPRPLISIPLSTISPALLDELTHEIGTLASVYHKPSEAFVGRGRVGADELSRKEAREGLPEGLVSASAAAAAMNAANAIQVVAQGQRSENLLDFGLDDDDEQAASSSTPTMSTGTINNSSSSGLFGLDFGSPPMNSNTSSGRNAGSVAQPSNTLDDLLGVFDQAGLGPGSNGGLIGGMSNLNLNANGGSQTTDLFGGAGNGNGMMSPTSVKSPPPQQQQKPNDDLMGDLF